MADQSEVGSPLSDLSSDAFEGDEDHEALPITMPPAKRQKRGHSFMDIDTPPLFQAGDTTISSDSEGEVPNSPNGPRADDDDVHEQVTFCNWEKCNVGDLGNMDNLVAHIHEEHVEVRGKKYTCEWNDCSRKSMPHASAYALKAHMRSHTKEKPFYCELPECDRSFTRSDALQKHYRTVHETESLRPSDPVPKSSHGNKQRQNSILIAEDPQSQGNSSGSPNGHSNGNPTGWVSSFPAELGFAAEEEARGPMELYRLLRRQVKWSEEDHNDLTGEVDGLEGLRKKEWLEKEILLDQCLKTEVSWHERRAMVIAGAAEPLKVNPEAAAWEDYGHSPSQLDPLPPTPSSKLERVGDQAEAAAVLASLYQG